MHFCRGGKFWGEMSFWATVLERWGNLCDKKLKKQQIVRSYTSLQTTDFVASSNRLCTYLCFNKVQIVHSFVLQQGTDCAFICVATRYRLCTHLCCNKVQVVHLFGPDLTAMVDRALENTHPCF